MSNQPNAAERPRAAVVLAAGMGTRMRSDTPKILHEVLGRTLVGWVLAAIEPLGAERVVLVVGPGFADDVRLPRQCGAVDVAIAVQREALGSGDALRAGLAPLKDFDGDVLVANGDGALFTTATMQELLEAHAAHSADVSALGIRGDVNLPYGRMIASDDGLLERIVEAGDASPDELAVDLLNAGMYVFDCAAVRADITQLNADNSQGEYYLTDLMGIAAAAGRRVRAVAAGTQDELLGVNTRADLAEAAAILQRRITGDHMLDGVTFELPDTCVVEPTVRIERDAVILPGSILRGDTTVATGAVIGPHTILNDVEVGERAEIIHSHAIEARIDEDVVVGPFAYLRPGTRLRPGSKVGTFVETKQTDLGRDSKIPHLSYIGDASVGSGVNIGAGNITANYRPELGAGKQRTTIGDNVRTGSDNVIVAPVTLEEGSFTGAGSIITEDVPAGALAIARARQVNLPNYAERLAKRSGAGTAGG